MKNKFTMAISMALVLALVAATFVLADNLLTDGDGVTPVVDTESLNLGNNVCLGTTITKDIAHAISRNGNYTSTNVFKNDTTVTISVDTVTGNGLSASGGGTITLPSNWDTVSNNTLSGSVLSSVMFEANTLGAFSGTVNYSATGIGSDVDKNKNPTNPPLTRTDTLTVTANVVNCDTTPPTLNLPADMTVEATGASGAVVSFTVTADDANPAHPTVTCDPASGSTFALDVTKTVNCSATDAAGNSANGNFTVTVVDTTPPTVTTPSSTTVEAADALGAVVAYSGESATDAVDGSLTASCSPVSGSTFPLGENTVTCSATDSHSNTGTTSFTIKVQDTTTPVLVLPADITAEATSGSGAAIDFAVSASDTVDGALTPSCDANSGDTFPLGTTLVSCSATDSNNNTASGSFNVTVQDMTAPSLTLPADFSVEATSSAGAVATFSASASDLVDGSVSVSCSPASGDNFLLGATPVSCSATDAAGNTGAGSFTITIVDTTPPALTLPADQQIEATGPGGANATFTASALDAVDGTLAVTCSSNSGDTFPLGTTTVNCSVSDVAGNEASGSFVIIVEDTTAPVITLVSRTPANGFGWNNGDVIVEWSCSDIVGVVSSSVSTTVSDEAENQSATGTCTDTSGNTASDTQSGINIDKTKPSASASRTPDANSNGWNNNDVIVSFTGSDALSGINFCSTDQIFGEGAGQTASGTCTDLAGNVSSPAVVNNINVDKTAPTINGAPDRAANVNGWYNADVTAYFTCNDALSGVDDCTAPVTLSEGAGQSVLGSVTDKAGNSANATVSGINIDETDPIISAALDISPAGSSWFNVSTGAPTVNFTCEDTLSNLDGACPSSHLFGDGESQSYSQTIYDLAGNSASAGVSNVDVDTAAPSISVVLDRSAAASGWFNEVTGAPVAKFTCSDATSGVVACPVEYTFPEGEDLSHEGMVFDNAGNSSTANVGSVYVDFTKPSLAWDPAVYADGASFYFDFLPVYPPNPCAAADLLSGPNGCSVTGYSTTVGTHTLTALAHDVAGNSYSEQRTYTVMAWTLKGFYQPVDMPNPAIILNTVKNGSTVPLKFEIFAGQTELTDVAVVDTLTYTQVTCTGTAPQDEIETLATGNTTLRYDTTGGQFIFNWKTPSGTAGKCFRVTMKADDGLSLVAYFKMK